MAAANGKHWSLETRLYHKVSEALLDNTPKKLHMSASTEAFALVAYEGNRVKWIELAVGHSQYRQSCATLAPLDVYFPQSFSASSPSTLKNGV